MTTQSRPTGPRGSSPGGRPGGGGGGVRRGGRPRYYARRKVCAFCVNHAKYIDYKDVNMLARYLSDQAKIESRRKSGVCSKHQRGLATAIKRARHLAMMPMSRNHLTAPLRGGPGR
ncbi:MAG: 30S ribosomal protein S18 [SAR202 cluster bacterium]|nr:30S ribosomal protein S18 [SAR202 cluster bacterium]